MKKLLTVLLVLSLAFVAFANAAPEAKKVTASNEFDAKLVPCYI